MPGFSESSETNMDEPDPEKARSANMVPAKLLAIRACPAGGLENMEVSRTNMNTASAMPRNVMRRTAVLLLPYTRRITNMLKARGGAMYAMSLLAVRPSTITAMKQAMSGITRSP